MSQLLLIDEPTRRIGLNEIGDIVGVFNDDHVFSEKEHRMFKIIQVPEDKAVIDAIGRTKKVFRSGTTEWTEEEPEQAEVWTNPITMEKTLITNPQKYKKRYDEDTQTIKPTFDRVDGNDTIVAVM